jgi:DNA mismatch repair ATPase MutS
MRQTALLVVLARMGSYVPASSARIGPVDRIFTRIGASDDLAGGRSTFMLEMTEAANILNNATDHSLVLMDEIGRGTSTYDGLSLAWACAVHIGKHVRAFTLFATHYFELTSLPSDIDGCVNVHLDATEHGDQLIFLHSVKEGPANQSYGLQVAALAGVPPKVITAAKKYLRELEQRSEAAHGPQAQQQLMLMPPQEAVNSPALDALANLDPDTMSPREALANDPSFKNFAICAVASAENTMPVCETGMTMCSLAPSILVSDTSNVPSLGSWKSANIRPSPILSEPAMMPTSRRPSHFRGLDDNTSSQIAAPNAAR